MPKISVVVPVYNTAQYLNKCLDSIINQTYQDIEVIIVNDGSTDNSQKIIDEYKEKYPEKVKSLNKENGGLSSARNCGIELATGEYIAFIDSDDYIDIELFDKLKNEIDKNIDLVKFKIIRVNDKYKEIEKVKGPVFEEKSGEEAFNLLVFNDILLEPACIYLYKKDLFIKNKFEFALNKYNEDFGLVPIIIINSRLVSSVDVYGYYYVQVDRSITRNEDYQRTYKSAMDLLFHYDNMIKAINKINISKKTIKNLKQYYTNSILMATKKIKKEDRNKYISEIKKRKMIKNIRITNVRTALKKCILYFSVEMYLKLK